MYVKCLAVDVRQVLEALSKHGLTLQNFSSVQEQQMGGWTQVGDNRSALASHIPQSIAPPPRMADYGYVCYLSGPPSIWILVHLAQRVGFDARLIGRSLLACMQVAAHGTGARLPTVEEQIVSMKVVTPAK
jgi:hypothetical protein